MRHTLRHSLLYKNQESAHSFGVAGRKFEDYIDLAPVGIFVIDEKGNYIESNKAASGITGFSIDQLHSMSFIDETPEDSFTKATILLNALIKCGKMGGELLYKHESGQRRWWRVDAVKLSEDRYLMFANDITEKRTVEENLLHMGHHDQLTGLYNRRFFESAIGEMSKNENLPISLIICDINGLKAVNDTLGYAAGDALLIQTAKILEDLNQTGEIMVRFGGDEFIVIYPNTDSKRVKEKVETIRVRSESSNNLNLPLSLSFGHDTKYDDTQSILKTIENAENQMFMHKMFIESSFRSKTIDVIMQTLFEKSDRESLHSKRVSAICKAIASSMHFDSEEIDLIRVAGLIHDIGKIGIKEGILNKVSGLNDEEWRDMKKHSEIGWRILNASKDFVYLADFVLSHHERWDGTGYPNGKMKEDIPVEARIIALADAFDAMTNDRTYKAKMTEEQAILEIKRCAGSHFDPAIVDVFVNKVMRNG